MAPSRLLEDLLGCCFGISSYDGHRDDQNNDNAQENGNEDVGRDNDKRDERANNEADTNVGFDNGNPNLCTTCRKVNFNSLFRGHECTAMQTRDGRKTYFHEPMCCKHEIGNDDLRGLLGKLDTHAATCSFCDFLYQCQVRLNLIPTEQEPRDLYCIIKPRLSLEDITLQAPSDKGRATSHSVQDIVALQICTVQKEEDFGQLRAWPTPQAILRMVDSGSKTLTRNKLAGGGLLGRQLDPNRVDYELIGQWLTLCRSTHSQCEEVDAGLIPGLLVIDCTTGYIVPLPAKENAVNHEANYVTLSYLWGTAGATDGPVVKPINCDGESGLALPAQRPLTISDAIRVVNQLGYRYLWVDRYCIPQDDGAAKHTQILNMGRIYSNSILTIIAAAGEGPEYGLPGVSSRARTAQLGVQITDEISLVLYEAPNDDITKSKWNTRGWTYQEGLLSKRRLVFTDVMVYFQCQEMHGDEVLSLPIPGPGEDFDEVRALSFDNLTHHYGLKLRMVFPRTSDWKDPLRAWDRIGEYGPRELGYDSDALNAISDVMEMYALAAGESGFKLFCGLPILPIRSWEKHWGRSGDRTRACSFRTWFEDDHPHGGASKAQEIDDNNLTCSLTYSLTWMHKWWGVSFKSSPACLEQARRSMFGSWTVAGWRTRKYKPDPISHFDSCLRIGVQYSDELLLDWEDDNARILDLSRNGKIPLSLNIRGVVMDVQMEWKRLQMGHGSREWREGWILTSPFIPLWNMNLFESPRWLFEEKGSDTKVNIDLLFLIMGGYYIERRRLSRLSDLVGMIIRPVTRMLDGQPHKFHENLGSYSFKLKPDYWPRLASLTREMEVRLI